MPNRMLRDWTDSFKFDGISAEAERLFVRLIMKADDYGRFHGNPKLVKSACFPLAESLRANTVSAWLTELSDRKLVFCYTVGTGEYLAIINYGQRLKSSRAKFPQLPGTEPDWRPMGDNFPEVPGSSGNVPPEEEVEVEEEYELLPPNPQEGEGQDRPDEIQTVVTGWNSTQGLPQIKAVTADRKRKIRTRLRESFFRDHWREALSSIPGRPFLMGDNDRGWTADIDWFLRPGSVAKLIEGGYSDSKPKPKAQSTELLDWEK